MIDNCGLMSEAFFYLLDTLSRLYGLPLNMYQEGIFKQLAGRHIQVDRAYILHLSCAGLEDTFQVFCEV